MTVELPWPYRIAQLGTLRRGRPSTKRWLGHLRAAPDLFRSRCGSSSLHGPRAESRLESPILSVPWEGVHDYSYVARATTPGNFVVPPPKAEEMYMPETFGRGASDRVIVE